MNKLAVCTALLQIVVCASFSLYGPKFGGDHYSYDSYFIQHRYPTTRIKTSLLVSYNGQAHEVDLTAGVLGPPELIRSLKIGEAVQAFRQSYKVCGTAYASNFTISRVSYTPDAFILRNFLAPDECDEIIKDASTSFMTRAETITPGDTKSRKHCQVSWLSSGGPNTSRIVSSLVQATANLFLTADVKSDKEAGVEDLQVLRYDIGGEYVLHHDGEPRVLTVLYYLNGVGKTWFPLARTSENIDDDPCKDINHDEASEAFAKTRAGAVMPQNKKQAMQLGENFIPGQQGLLVQSLSGAIGDSQEETKKNLDNSNIAWINRGDALVFYNYLDDGSSRLNWRALHTALPTGDGDGVKWIANHWFRGGTLASHRENKKDT
uniref:Fe2OG dioxygenase domain-containing protein n=1 Tax=Helicotheca tamesis TaxID=374047 RepID=A0A7S2GTF2_9STRA|mmetsp:Transcript_11928/g.16486  ORF Transcript_11928/g.16486 Transcript_11928/m.16486 type:complete len:377 (+) Transcript_11928:35-1165(+)|eukprot:CAMPEP_0185726826 /NCGR_PEP_ID=MMETSP1171-20130828/2685_1 /TAXON_ID=374046 /ORGANISM="Helicotheca tamensis, Strain CCMP826" /LENGTH=376 /DNA_ID=CAMNT_0028395249 /DNA_START=21 /DNA_END=1151 /DNA_ORIENTATION=-